ncbi:ATP-binding cassette domain-containing protein [Rhodobacteraceae bacterium CCMM004]|nr:ATP-binding cassette domain-containing protein [Rhodobacteraceae bacterium CCMM004]
MLRLEGVRIRLGDFALAADFALPAGALAAVLGPSGSGKSTLLGAVGGFLPVAQGRISWTGRDLTDLPPGARPVATIFQDNNLFPHMDAAANVALGLRPGGRLSAAERAAVDGALERVGLAGYAGRRPADLSGGQQSRVALARMLVQDRPLVTLDEPFAALGPALRAEMVALVRDLARDAGRTVLMVTHAPEDARRLGGLAIAVGDGRAAPPVPVAQLLDDPPPALRDYLGG